MMGTDVSKLPTERIEKGTHIEIPNRVVLWWRRNVHCRHRMRHRFFASWGGKEFFALLMIREKRHPDWYAKQFCERCLQIVVPDRRISQNEGPAHLRDVFAREVPNPFDPALWPPKPSDSEVFDLLVEDAKNGDDAPLWG